MEWKDVGSIVGTSAPLIGKLVSIGVSFIPGIGPIAGPIIGPAIGSILAKQFGVAPTPEAVSGAISANGGAESDIVKAKLAAATEEVKAQYHWAEAVETGRLKLEEVQLTQVNETARAELQIESPFKTWWRPFNGWVLGYGTAGTVTLMFVALILAMLGNPDPINVMINAWLLILSVLGLPAAVVGVAVWQRGGEKMETIKAVASGNAVLVPARPQLPAPPVPPSGGSVGKPPVLKVTPPAPQPPVLPGGRLKREDSP